MLSNNIAVQSSNPWTSTYADLIDDQEVYHADLGGVSAFLAFKQTQTPTSNSLTLSQSSPQQEVLDKMQKILQILQNIRTQQIEFQERHALLHYSDMLVSSQINHHSQICGQLAQTLRLVQVNRNQILTQIATLSKQQYTSSLQLNRNDQKKLIEAISSFAVQCEKVFKKQSTDWSTHWERDTIECEQSSGQIERKCQNSLRLKEQLDAMVETLEQLKTIIQAS